MPTTLNVLIEKNILLEKRSWTWTLFELLAIFAFCTVIVVNPTAKPKEILKPIENIQKTHFFGNQTSLYDLSAFLRLQSIEKRQMRYGLIFAPHTKLTSHIISATQKALKIRHSLGVDSEKILRGNFNKDTHFAGIIFNNITNDDDNSKLLEKFSISLVFPSEFRTIDNKEMIRRLWLTRCTGELTYLDTANFNSTDLYLREGFLQLQHRLFMEWLRVRRNWPNVQDNVDEEELQDQTMDGTIPVITVQSFRHYTQYEPCLETASSNIIWFLYNFTFFVPFLGLLRRFSREHEANIHAHHWIYGYKPGHHRGAHFFVSFIHFFGLIVIIYISVLIEWTIMGKYHHFLHVTTLVLLIFLCLYIINLILYAMIVATLFVYRKTSMLFGVAMWFGCYGLFSVVLDNTESLTQPLLIAMMIFFNNFYPYGMKIMKPLDKEPNYEDIWRLINAQVVYLFLLIFLLSLVNFLRPARYMPRNYFNFLCLPYCCKIRRSYNVQYRRPTNVLHVRPSTYNVEYGPIYISEDILYLKNIKHYTYGIRNNQILKTVSIRFFSNEISVILGPHGTGKRHLITMMAGWKKPQSGRIWYDGRYDIYENWLYYRNKIDVSMTNNPLYELLTVKETLYYFCEIKMEEKDLYEKEIEKWLNTLRPIISNIDNLMVKNLSFSQKRLVSLCCTLLGDRAIILLDEPTLHMTVAEQRYYWDILRREKHDRAIIMSTISIDEAEAVGDRIVLMSDGRLLASGTLLFLKTQFGIGFDLIIFKDTHAPCEPITDLINIFIPNIIPANHVGERLLYKLPADQRAIYQHLLLKLEGKSKELGIKQIHVKGSGLSEIYMKLGLAGSTGGGQVRECTQICKKKICSEPKQPVRNLQIHAMLYKKMIYQAANIVPALMIVLVILLIFFINKLTKNVESPGGINNGIHLGMSMNATQRDLPVNVQECSFTKIIDLKTAPIQMRFNDRPIYFLFSKLNCGKDSYKLEVMRDHSVYNKFGAVESLNGGKHMVIWINQRVFHTAALTLNLAHNIILSELYPKQPEILAAVVNKPMIIPLHVKINLADNEISHLRLPLTMGIIMPITISCFVISLIEERCSHLMTLQRLAGLQIHIFWFVGILWDFGTLFTFNFIYFLVMCFFTIEGLVLANKLITLLLLNVHGLSALCGIYFLSLFMPNCKYRGFLISIIIHFIFGLCAYVFYWDVMQNNQLFHYTLSLFPTYALLDGIGNLYTGSKQQEYCRDRCNVAFGCNAKNMCTLIDCCYDAFSSWSSPGILASLFFMILSGFLAGLGFFFVEYYRRQVLHITSSRAKQLGTVCYPCDDKDVINEKVRIADMDLSECKKYQLLVDQVEYCIPTYSTFLKTISFALEGYKSLAIYGGNHCGKSHLLQQLIGEQKVNFGEMYLCGKDAKYEDYTAYQHVGYCPQTKGLCNAFSPRQLFTFIFMLQAIPVEEASNKLKEISKALNLRQYMAQRIIFLSPNIKRRLNIGLAHILDKKILVIDEPTWGMPAIDRRLIWNFLKNERACGNCVVFSSCDTLECQTLCDYMLVFDNGEMLAYGSPEYLTDKFGYGFYIEVKLLLDGQTSEEAEENFEIDNENMMTFVKFLHPNSMLVNRCENVLKFFIPTNRGFQFSHVFGSLEKHRERLSISEYTIDLPTQLQVMDNILATRKLRDKYKKSRMVKQQESAKGLQETRDVANIQEFQIYNTSERTNDNGSIHNKARVQRPSGETANDIEYLQDLELPEQRLSLDESLHLTEERFIFSLVDNIIEQALDGSVDDSGTVSEISVHTASSDLSLSGEELDPQITKNQDSKKEDKK